jgi:hypothetical protein
MAEGESSPIFTVTGAIFRSAATPANPTEADDLKEPDLGMA